MVGETPATAAPAGTIAAKRKRIARPRVRAPAAVLSAADPIGGAPSAAWRNVTINSFGVGACGRARVRAATRVFARAPAAGNLRGEGAGNSRLVARVMELVACPSGRKAAEETPDTVTTPAREPSCGIHPVGLASLPQRASTSAATATAAVRITGFEGVMLLPRAQGPPLLRLLRHARLKRRRCTSNTSRYRSSARTSTVCRRRRPRRGIRTSGWRRPRRASSRTIPPSSRPCRRC